MLAGLVLLAILFRLVLSAFSWGTTDTISFFRFSQEIQGRGLLRTYRDDPEFNHPPIPAYWAWAAAKVSSSPPPFGFPFVFRLATILADVATIVVLWRIWRRRAGPTRAWQVAVLYAWCPTAILMSAYHGNTDSIYAFLCLLCVYLLEETGRAFWAGVALAAAINIKLIPVLLIVPLVLSFRDWKSAIRFALGLVPGVVPFVAPLVLAGASFARNALAYKSNGLMWGVNFFLLLGTSPEAALPPAARIYHDYGRYLLLLLVLGWSVLARVRGRWERYELATVTLAIFLVFAPGFGVQYTIILVGLWFAFQPRWACGYGILAGLFLLAAYVVFWDGDFPFSSLFTRSLPPAVACVGLLPWGMLVWFLVRVVRESLRRVPTGEPAESGPSGRTR